ncbi:MAG TPA: hypothetical protein VGR88_04205 [Ktedonobacterales bacterium]|jgi:hypothetical protein|nr:hypothetical protein [Ktedonobacterales bacterium]
MVSASTAFHLLGALRRAIGKVFMWFFLLLIVGAGASEIVGYAVGGHHLHLLTHIAAAAVGLTLGYAAALTVLVGEVIKVLVGTVHSAEKEVKTELGMGGKLVNSLVDGIEHKK